MASLLEQQCDDHIACIVSFLGFYDTFRISYTSKQMLQKITLYRERNKQGWLNVVMSCQLSFKQTNIALERYAFSEMTMFHSKRMHRNAVLEWFKKHKKRLTNLRILDLSHQDMNNIECVKDLTQLKVLNLSSTGAKNLQGIKNLTQLEVLNFRRTNIESVRAISLLVNLRKLDVSRTKIDSIRHLSTLINLEFLNISKTAVSDITVLSGLRKLVYLCIARIRKLSAMDEDIELDISPLASLRLKHLDLNSSRLNIQTAITTLETLESSLKLLDVSFCGLPNMTHLHIETVYDSKFFGHYDEKVWNRM